jgi:hypothetical protein
MADEPTPSVEAPSAALASGTDAISEAQKSMDGEGTPVPAAAPILDPTTQRVDKLETQFRGMVQGPLNRIEEQLKTLSGREQEEQEKQWLEAQSEETRPVLQFFNQKLGEQAQRIAELTDIVQAQQGQAPPQVSDQAKDFVRGYQLNPDDPRIDYAAYNLGTDEGTRAFMDSIYAAKGSPTAAKAAAAATSTPEAPPRLPSPTDGPPAQGGLGDEDEIMSWGIRTGNWTEMKDKLREIGSPLGA